MLHSQRVASVLDLAGVRYWTASVLPAVVGTTLPLWLQPPGFSFRWLGALEFLVATVLMHSGFSILLARFEHRCPESWSEFRLLGAALTCISLACLLGFHLSTLMAGGIFLVYGIATIFVGLLYVAPPARLAQRAGGEVVVSMSLSFVPLLGAYLVQTGDLTRPVYIAALPIYAATGLWVWTGLLASSSHDEAVGRETLVRVFGARFSGRVVVPAIVVLFFVTLLLAVLSSSVMPLGLAALLLSGVLWRIVAVTRSGYGDVSQMLQVRSGASIVHLGLCVVLAASSLAAVFG
jgi:1,4-dihydroxy-2-naphthoate octaprenyltransferase